MRHILEVVIGVKYTDYDMEDDKIENMDKIVVLTKEIILPDNFVPVKDMEINLKYAFGFTINHIVYFPQTNAYLLRNDLLNIKNQNKEFYDATIQRYKDVGFVEGHIDLTKKQ